MIYYLLWMATAILLYGITRHIESIENTHQN